MDRSKWEYKKLEVDNLPIGDVFDIFMGRTPSRDDLSLWEDGSHEWVSIGDMGTTKYISDTKEKVSDKACTNMRLVPKDTVIMSFKLSIGKVAITEIPLYTNEAIMAFPPKSGYNISPNYLYYHLQAYKWQSANRAVMGKTLNKTVISSSRITIPDSETQQRIVAELDCLNEMIALKQEQLKEFDKLAQSIFYDMFGDPATNEKGWELREMESLCTHIVDCPHSTPKKVDVITPFPCIRTSELKGGEVQWDTMQYLDEQEYEIRVKRLRPLPGDIVFGREGTIGDAVILPRGYNFSLGQRTMLLRVDKSVISEIFLHRTIMSEWVRRQIKMVNVSSTVAHVNIKDFKVFDIPLPPLALQQQFAEKIQAIEAQKELVKQSIAETQHLLDSRMDYFFD